MRCTHAAGFVGFFTFGALEWSLIGMRPYVNGKFALLLECLVTHLAFVAFVCKRTQMRKQSLFRKELFIFRMGDGINEFVSDINGFD